MRPKLGQNQSRRGARRIAWAGALAAICAPLPACAATPDLATVTGGIAAGAVALAAAAGLWALAEQHAARQLRRLVRNAESRARAGVNARDALIGAGREAVLVWGRDGTAPRSYGGAELLLDSCLAGPDATALSSALDALGEKGAGFALIARDKNGRGIRLRGRAVGGMAAVWLEEEAPAQSLSTDFRAVLDALPIPVWLRDKTLSLLWGNRAYLAATDMPSEEALISTQTALDRSERDLAAAARAEDGPLEAKRFAIMGGQRRALSFTHVPVGDGRIVGTAVDVTEITSAEARLQQHLDAHSDTLDKLATAVAIFGRDQKLTFHNAAFARLWDLPEKWLETHPSDGEILDRLRETRHLPEQPNYQAWKRQRLALYEKPGEYLPEELWHVPGGQTLRVVAQPHPFGGLTFLYEDVTEKLALESSYNTLIKVQSATLDTLQEGVAVFGPDGRMKLHNAAFAKLWELEPADLAGEPHIARIAKVSVARYGEEAAWEKLVAAVSSGSERRSDWGEIERNDKSIVSASLAPLPDGATLVTFADVTDRSRIEGALRDRAEALEAADRLKSEFVYQASFLFRDPLNAVVGFADLLHEGHAGSLNPKQTGYVQDILTASGELIEITSDLLDLAMIDSGAMQLQLAPFDLYELLSKFAARLRKNAESRAISLVLDCKPDVGAVVLDQRRIRQVVFNLISNALNFTPAGGIITLGGGIVGDDVQIWVSDTGPGIAREVMANVFERFAAKGRAGRRAGAGLGLALVNRLVELHHGWVEVQSAPGQGTFVRCHLPRRVEDFSPVQRIA
ncbi:MAG TPA: PAS-domain containing protein [Rhizomicrobium sp.]|jgi:signal transduction histidine kinase|nr:PAS-domain containing protein [Rhizomicrobium sp.]